MPTSESIVESEWDCTFVGTRNGLICVSGAKDMSPDLALFVASELIRVVREQASLSKTTDSKKD